MEKYGQYCPVAKSLQVLGGRWTLLIVRDMLFGGSSRFNELAKGLPRLSRGVLSQRLRELQEAGIVERHEGPENGRPEYRLTRAGRDLRPVLESLLEWGANWAFEEPEEDDLDPVLLMWWVRAGVAIERLPEARTVVQFDFRGESQKFWLILEASDVSLCLKRPRFDVDIWVSANLSAFYEVWLGRVDYWQAVHDGGIEVEAATPSLEREFPTWLHCSPTSSAVRDAVAARTGQSKGAA